MFANAASTPVLCNAGDVMSPGCENDDGRRGGRVDGDLLPVLRALELPGLVYGTVSRRDGVNLGGDPMNGDPTGGGGGGGGGMERFLILIVDSIVFDAGSLKCRFSSTDPSRVEIALPSKSMYESFFLKSDMPADAILRIEVH
jgi:hypothetical protein